MTVYIELYGDTNDEIRANLTFTISPNSENVTSQVLRLSPTKENEKDI